MGAHKAAGRHAPGSGATLAEGVILPELPEVETIMRQLQPLLPGKVIGRVDVLDPRITAPVTPTAFSRSLKGKQIEAVTRRGKYLRLELAGGEVLVIHLRMTGVLSFEAAGKHAARPHLRLVIEFAGGGALLFQDQRRFGTATLLDPVRAQTYFSRLGPEPLERSFNAARLRELLTGRRRPVKSLLLDQHVVAGIGNIYADEALYRAGIRPTREAGDISAGEAARLSAAIKSTLRDAIALQGSSIDTYRDSRGRRGRFQETFRVHRRAGEPCPGCAGEIVKIKLGGRGTYYCPRCQK
ncbi:MAG: bifunctional DNA-formamidopyrimidine glycosylase/DNA-(apurinic or apyrimidinic site) lyase [Thermoleophilia bacterium]